MLDVLSVADMCVDLVLTGNVRPQFHQVEQIIGGYTLELGGSANIFASQFGKLGGDAGVVGWVGPDFFGDLVLQRLRESGVDTTRVRRHPTEKTGLGVALAEPGDRAILTYPGTIDAVTPEQLTGDLTAAARHWHVASYFLLTRLRDQWKRWLEECKRTRLTTSFDPNWDPEDRWEGIEELLPLIDVFFPNENEALRITGAPDVRSAGAKLAARGPLVVVKCGSEGALAFRGTECVAIPAPASARVVDSIGAGDNFDAGFLRGWLLGWRLEDCLHLATRCAVASLAEPGGIAGQLRQKISPSTNS